MRRLFVGQTSLDPPLAQREVAPVSAIGTVDKAPPAAFYNVTRNSHQPDVGQAQPQDQPREALGPVDSALVETKASALPVAEELFNPLRLR